MTSKQPFLSLNEAITSLFGKSRTPTQEAQLRVADQKRLVRLIDQCVYEAEIALEHRLFPRCLPYYPRSALLDRLEACRPCWPPGAKGLYREAARQEKKWGRYDQEYQGALERIVASAQRGTLRFLGQTGRQPGAIVQYVNPEYFLGQVTIDYQWASIGPDTTASPRPRPGAILKCGPNILPNYYNVVIAANEFRSFFASDLPSTQGNNVKKNFDQLEQWYVNEHLTVFSDQYPPSRDIDEKAATKQFPFFKKLRPALRLLRKTHLKPELGRRKSAKK